MLDPNYVRENLEAVRAAMKARNFPPDALDRFAELDAERRRVNSEADAVNHERNRKGRPSLRSDVMMRTPQCANFFRACRICRRQTSPSAPMNQQMLRYADGAHRVNSVSR
ncbi:MAG: hypothetical protein DYH05_12765 [Acidobacteria bacterium ACB1]|nr:hypothetical protein [Acidobacteria bacterium ACB1]